MDRRFDCVVTARNVYEYVCLKNEGAALNTTV